MTRPIQGCGTGIARGTMSGLRRVGELLDSIKSVLIPLAAACFLFYAVEDIGPAWSARLGNGTHGTFVAVRCERTAKAGCFWKGVFISDDGRIRRKDVGLASGGNVTHVGQQTQAMDTGDRANVFPVGGGWDWLIVTVFLVLSIAIIAIWTLVVPVQALLRRRTSLTHRRRSA